MQPWRGNPAMEVTMYEKLDKHSLLVNRMAASAQVDLAEVLLRGRLSPYALRGAIHSCTHCQHVARCEAHLAALPGDGAAREIPVYCRNKALFDNLPRTVPA
ncbi:DUF6455 family protein [Ruixingdingia sedimenti]|uniref:DUF6455 family protein n=1 Tax=Ruixingdingia sedimenti TaxID=3073604 RepID=A0ABU1F5B6_9RHOB|nr:DUF6455 family protein [Xinfangfangia sp. LG-4]MDR5651624.1 DUF6455 family protein [Xinfangfangia sp. LG-4]